MHFDAVVPIVEEEEGGPAAKEVNVEPEYGDSGDYTESDEEEGEEEGAKEEEETQAEETMSFITKLPLKFFFCVGLLWYLVPVITKLPLDFFFCVELLWFLVPVITKLPLVFFMCRTTFVFGACNNKIAT